MNNSYMSVGNCAVQNTYIGIISNNSYYWSTLDFVSSSGNQLWGFEYQGCMGLGATQTIACSNGGPLGPGAGLMVQTDCAIRQGGNFIVYAKGNSGPGIYALAGSGVQCGSSQFLYNGNWGILSSQAQVSCSSSNFVGNANGAIWAYAGGGVAANGSAGVTGACVPAANTQGNGFAYVIV
jgi:hypothetical protein